MLILLIQIVSEFTEQSMNTLTTLARYIRAQFAHDLQMMISVDTARKPWSFSSTTGEKGELCLSGSIEKKHHVYVMILPDRVNIRLDIRRTSLEDRKDEAHSINTHEIRRDEVLHVEAEAYSINDTHEMFYISNEWLFVDPEFSSEALTKWVANTYNQDPFRTNLEYFS
jgi:hypothetical protein